MFRRKTKDAGIKFRFKSQQSEGEVGKNRSRLILNAVSFDTYCGVYQEKALGNQRPFDSSIREILSWVDRQSNSEMQSGYMPQRSPKILASSLRVRIRRDPGRGAHKMDQEF